MANKVIVVHGDGKFTAATFEEVGSNSQLVKLLFASQNAVLDAQTEKNEIEETDLGETIKENGGNSQSSGAELNREQKNSSNQR